MTVNHDLADAAEPMRDDPVLILVMRARNGDRRAWAALVERYAPLIWSVCRRYQLDSADADDVGQSVWLRLVLREAFAHLPPRCQQLITLLIQDPPLPYADISARLDIPVGSIGPNRRRCLDKLRHHPAIAALINLEAQTT